MTIKVGINGMGRIGRMVVRSIIESQDKKIKIQHINNRSNSEATCTLIKYDSIHGTFNAEVKFDKKHIIINKKKISFGQETDLNKINWIKDRDSFLSYSLMKNSVIYNVKFLRFDEEKVLYYKMSDSAFIKDNTITFDKSLNIIHTMQKAKTYILKFLIFLW